MLKKSHQKKLILINRDFQIKYAKLSVFVGIITTGLTAFVILYPLYIFEVLRVPKFLPLPILIAMSSTVFINVFALAFMAIVMSHRVAGPMFALFREIRKVGSGQFDVELKVRDQDEFGFIVRNFNEMAENLRQETVYDLSILEQFEQGLDKDLGKESLKASLDELKTRLETRLGQENSTP